MICILDASALLALARGEPGADVVDALLSDESNLCYAHALNLCEFFYDRRRSGGEQFAQDKLRELSELGVVFRDDLDPAFWQDAGRIKADWAKVSLADCCGIALAQRLAGRFHTGDHHELDRLSESGAFPIQFFR